MRRIVLSFIALVALAAPGFALADLKIGYVDLQRALNEVQEGKAAKARLQARLEKSQAQLDKEKEALRAKQEELEKKRLAMDEATLRQRLEELDKEMMRYSNLAAQLQRELAEEERQVTQEIFGRMRKIIGEIAEKEGFDFVFEANESGILHAPAALDLTNELVRRYDAAHKGK
ncbi:MAG TPA: OmpH family outer membrane protein [Fredinandcohnia sp.]|nr:OmpH family outer membrane protein [Fredinandcohnia sp.]